MLSTLETPRINGGGGSGLHASSSTGNKPQRRRTAPKPINTPSEKFESGCFDMAAVLVPPSTNGNAWGREIGITTAASAANRKDDAATNRSSTTMSDPTPAESSSQTLQKQPKKERAESNASDVTTKSSSSSSSSTSSSSSSDNKGKPWRNQSPAENQAQDTAGSNDEEYRASFPAVGEEGPEAAGKPATTPSKAQPALLLPSKSSSASNQEDPLGVENSGSENGRALETKQPTPEETESTPPPPPTVFSTPSPDDAVDEAEKERRKQALALEQQQLILARVKEAREQQQQQQQRSKGKHGGNKSKREASQRTKLLHKPQPPKQQQPPPKQQQPPPPPETREEGGSPTPKPKRGPRTKGRLFKRTEDGTLVEDKSSSGGGKNNHAGKNPRNRGHRPRANKKPHPKREKVVVNPHWVNEAA